MPPDINCCIYINNTILVTMHILPTPTPSFYYIDLSHKLR